jgi:hypothetical protein
MLNIGKWVVECFGQGTGEFWQVPQESIRIATDHFLKQLNNIEPEILTGLWERGVVNSLDKFLNKRLEVISFKNIGLDFGRKLGNNFKGQLAIVFDFVPKV